MHLSIDTYTTIAKPTEAVLFKDRKSKFFGYAFPVGMESDVKPILETLKNQYPTASHFCYAWQLGVEKKNYRANDDGEPKNTAGMPIYGQIQSFELTNVLVIVIRIFGGVKLGVSGLINAYKTAAQMVLESAIVEKRIIEAQLKLNFGYAFMNEVMRIVKKRNIRIVSQQMENECLLHIAVPRNQTGIILQEFEKIHAVSITQL